MEILACPKANAFKADTLQRSSLPAGLLFKVSCILWDPSSFVPSNKEICCACCSCFMTIIPFVCHKNALEALYFLTGEFLCSSLWHPHEEIPLGTHGHLVIGLFYLATETQGTSHLWSPGMLLGWGGSAVGSRLKCKHFGLGGQGQALGIAVCQLCELGRPFTPLRPQLSLLRIGNESTRWGIL